MTKDIASLWPSQIRAKIRSPFAILQGQAEALSEQTGRLLIGEVKRRTDGGRVVLSLEIVVPALGGYRHKVMSAAHGIETVYPATVDAEVFRASRVPNYIAAAALTLGSEGKKPDNRADSDQEFGELVGKVLQSSYVLSAAQSLIARANDVLAEKELAAQNPTLTQPEVLAPEASPPQPPMLDTPSS